MKNTDPKIICAGLVKVADGIRVISDEAMAEINIAKKNTELSKREIDVLGELSRGQNNKQIAIALGISPKTVDTHRTNLLRKMNVTSTASLLVSAMRKGMIDV